jgi:hypothetical protein
MSHALLAIFVAACVLGLLAWIIGMWNLIRIPFNLKPGVDAWATGNPFNHILSSDSLTSAGLAARRRLGQCFLLFVAALAVGAAAGLLAKWTA